MTLDVQKGKFLAHFGILGMKWGRHRAGAPTAEETARVNRDRVKKLKKKKISDLTDNEIKELMGRLNLEKQLGDMHPTKANENAKALKELATAQRDRINSLKKKKTSQLTDDELKDLTNRLQLEKQLRDISPSKVSAAKKVVGEVLLNSGKQVATTYATKYMTLGVEKLIGSFATQRAKEAVAEEVAKATAKKVAEGAAKEAAKAAAKETASKAVKETIKVTAKDIFEKAAEKTVKEAAKETIIIDSDEVIKKAIVLYQNRHP